MIFTDQVALDEEIAAKLIVMADKYNVKCLKTVCSHFLGANINANNCYNILLTARMTNCDILEKQCGTFLIKNVAEVMRTKGWEEMGSSHPEVFKIIFGTHGDSYRTSKEWHPSL
jgi:speckle-type POZ protein